MSNLTIYNASREPLVINPYNVLFLKKDGLRVKMAFVGGQEMSVKFVDLATTTEFVQRVSAVFRAKNQANLNTMPEGTTSFWIGNDEEPFMGNTDEFDSQKRTQ